MSTDRELLELAARAAGIDYWIVKFAPRSAPIEKLHMTVDGETVEWNPLTDDGDALRLAVMLRLVVDCSRPSAGEPWKQHAIWLDELMSNEELCRRAIVMAAAEIGRAMP